MGETRDHQSDQETLVDSGDRSEETAMSDAIDRMSERNTFVVQVRLQQNATWQGSIHWVEGERTRHFRSALELLRLMDEALSKKSKP